MVNLNFRHIAVGFVDGVRHCVLGVDMAEFNAHHISVVWKITNLQFGCEGCVCVLLLDGSKNEVCIMIYALSPSS